MRKPWTTTETKLLIGLWSTAKVSELARMFGRNPDAIYSKARFLDLPPLKKQVRVPVKNKQRVSTTVIRLTSDRHPLWRVGPRDCRWPVGDPGNDDFHFCQKPIVEGEPYCSDHRARAYHRPVRHLDAGRF